MGRREQILLVVLIAILVVWQGSKVARRTMWEPIKLSQFELDTLARAVSDAEDRQLELLRAERRIESLALRCLPPDPLDAQRLYQQWLTRLAEISGFAELKVTPDRVLTKSPACSAVVVSINGEATLGQLCLFLRRFYRTDLMQQISLLNIDSKTDRGDPVLRINMIAEGLVLRDAPPRRHLFPETRTAGELLGDDTKLLVQDAANFPRREFLARIGSEYLRVIRAAGNEWTVERAAEYSSSQTHAANATVELWPIVDQEPSIDFETFLARNPFAKPPDKVAVAVTPVPGDEPEVPTVDAAEFTVLFGTATGENKSAWLYDRLNEKKLVVSVGEPFAIAGIEGQVVKIETEYLFFTHKNETWRLKVGKDLRSMQQVDSP